MRLPLIIIGIAMVVAGIAIVIIYPYGPPPTGHHTLPEGGAGIAVLGVILIGGGLSMKTKGAVMSGQFKCSVCGKTFDSEQALNAHSKDKHPA